MFDTCLFTYKRGDSTGKTCGAKSIRDTGFCNTHLFHIRSQSSPDKSSILAQLTLSGDIDKIRKCLNHIPLTQNQIHNQVKQCLNKCDSKSRDVLKVIMTSSKYFPEIFNYDFNQNPIRDSVEKLIFDTFIYKSYLIKLALQSFTNDFPALNDLVPRFLTPGLYPRD